MCFHTKFGGCNSKNKPATPLTISNFSRAWQAYFLSYTLQIWCENTSFKDVQMMCNNDFDTSSGFRFEKIWLSCTVHICSLYLDYSTWFCGFFLLFMIMTVKSKGHSWWVFSLRSTSFLCVQIEQLEQQKNKTAIERVEGGNWSLECKKPHKLKWPLLSLWSPTPFIGRRPKYTLWWTVLWEKK